MPLGGMIPYPGVYPDPLDPQSVQDMSNAFAGRPAATAPSIPEQAVQHAPDPVEAEAYATPPPAPEIDQSAGNKDREEMVGIGKTGNAMLFPGMYGQPAMPQVMDEGANYLPFGGTKGRENVEETFVNQPDRMAKAVMAGAQAQEDESKAKAAFYGTERDRTRDYEAQLKEQYMLRQQEMMGRLQEVQQTAQKYTNNLADTGAFWHNPQNVMAAMGAALMQLTTDDRSFGYKLLNGAIQHDLQNRRQLADTHLGYLKSNMVEYDRIAGDRIAGMQLAEAEAKRVAAYELERIAAQFQGPKAKANAEAIISKLKIEAMEGFMRAYQSGIYNKPTALPAPIKNSYVKTGKATGGVGYSPFAGPPSATGPAGGPQGQVPTRAGMGQGAPVQGQSAMSAGQTGAAPQGGFPSLTPEQKKVIDQRYEGGSSIVSMAQQDTIRQAYRHAGVRPGTPPEMMAPAQKTAFNNSMETQEREAYDALKGVSQGLAQSSGRRSGLKAIQTDMAVVESAVNAFQKRGLNITMDDVLSTKTKATLGSDTASKWKNLYKAWAGASPENRSKYEAERDKIEAAGARLNQLLAGTVNSYYKDMAGAAVTVVELPRLQEYAGGNLTYDKLKTFVGEESSQAKAVEDNFIHNLPPAAAAMWLTRKGTGRTPMEGPNMRKYQAPEAQEEGRNTPTKQPAKLDFSNAGAAAGPLGKFFQGQ